MDITILLSLLSLCIIGYTTWTNAYEYNTFADTVASIGGNEGTIMIASEQAVTDNLIIPVNITLRFLQGGTLNISVGKTVTINGHVEAGGYQIFEGAGTVVVNTHPHQELWWGRAGGGFSVVCAFRAYLTTDNQAIGGAALTKILFNAENYDIGGDFDADGVDSDFTAPSAGYYLINATITLASVTDQKVMDLEIYKNGADNIAVYIKGSSVATGQSISVFSQEYLAEGDVIDIRFECNEAVNIIIGSHKTFFAISKLGE